MSARLVLLLPVLAAACTQTNPIAVGDLAGPVALAIAERIEGTTSTPVLYIANADNDELRAFLPDTNLFERGPNAISPLSIPLGFRPEHLAAGLAFGANGKRGYVLVGGASNAVRVVDAQTSRVVAASGEAESCRSGTAAPGCLPGEVIDVAVGGTTAFALLADDGTGMAGLAVMTPTLQTQAGATVPVLTLSGDILSLDGSFSGLAASADGTKVWVADRATPRIVEVTISGNVRRDLEAAGPVRDVFPTPAYTSLSGTAHPAGEYLLAILTDGRLQTISPNAGGPAADPLDNALPIAPLSFGTPVRDVGFVPCPGAACKTVLAIGSSDSRSVPLLGFAALGDGTIAAILPDDTKAQVFRPIDTNAAGPTVSSSQLTIEPNSVTEGITRSEIITATYQGLLPGLSSRAGSFVETGGTLTITDDAGGLDVAMERDAVNVRLVSKSCAGVPATFDATVAAASATSLTVTTSTDLTGCLPARVVYEVRAGETRPWVVSGTFSGFITRGVNGDRVVVEGTRYYYPDSPRAGVAVAFSLPSTSPEAGTSFSLTTSSGLTPYRTPTSSGSLASAIAALPGRLFASVLTVAFSNGAIGTVLYDISLPAANTSTGITTYQ